MSRVDGKHVLLAGASGGVGRAMLAQWRERDDIAVIHAIRHASEAPAEDDGRIGAEVRWHRLDATDDGAVGELAGSLERLDWCVNACGLLHAGDRGPEKNIREFDADFFALNLRVNCTSSLLLAKHTADLLKRAEAGIFAAITARIGSIADNRRGGWYSYRASKAAANMALKTLAIEWSRTAKQVRVLALHPGTVDTDLSAPFHSSVPDEQLFPPEKSARLLIARIDEAHEHESGRFIAYDGEEIPW